MPLNYLCHWRVNNLMSKVVLKENYPIQLITTCGHLIHDSCISRDLHNNHKTMDDYECPLCKTFCNLIVLTGPPTEASAKDFKSRTE